MCAAVSWLEAAARLLRSRWARRTQVGLLSVASSRLLNRKVKGDLAELKVAAGLVARGYKIALP